MIQHNRSTRLEHRDFHSSSLNFEETLKMMVTSASLIAFFGVIASGQHVLYESREGYVRGSWIQADRVQPDALIPFRIALKQNNLEAGQD